MQRGYEAKSPRPYCRLCVKQHPIRSLLLVQPTHFEDPWIWASHDRKPLERRMVSKKYDTIKGQIHLESAKYTHWTWHTQNCFNEHENRANPLHKLIYSREAHFSLNYLTTWVNMKNINIQSSCRGQRTKSWLITLGQESCQNLPATLDLGCVLSGSLLWYLAFLVSSIWLNPLDLSFILKLCSWI